MNAYLDVPIITEEIEHLQPDSEEHRVEDNSPNIEGQAEKLEDQEDEGKLVSIFKKKRPFLLKN